MAQSSSQDASKAETDKPQNVFRSEVKLVSVYFAVRDSKKQLASTLEKSQFRVYEDGKEQAIKFFAHHTDVVLNVGMLLDTGTSMAWMLNEEAQASSLFLKHVVRPTDLGFALSYANRVETLQVPTSDTALLQERWTPFAVEVQSWDQRARALHLLHQDRGLAVPTCRAPYQTRVEPGSHTIKTARPISTTRFA